MLLGRSIHFATFLIAKFKLNFDGAIGKIPRETVGFIDLTTSINLLMIYNVNGHSVMLFLFIE